MTYDQAAMALTEFMALYRRIGVIDERLAVGKKMAKAMKTGEQFRTREDIGIGGEYVPGIVLMPDTVVFDIIKAIIFHFERPAYWPWN